jgi:hypothetical protein
MAFTDKDKEELSRVQARRASGVALPPAFPGVAQDRGRNGSRQVGPGSANELAALGRIHEKVKAERTARESDEWYSGNSGASFRETPSGTVKAIKGGSGGPSGTVVKSISGIPGRN